MQCPVCTDVVLAISSREGVEIDYCPQCRGVWLDRGELDKIIDRVAATPGGGAAPPTSRPAYEDRGHDERSHDDRSYDDRSYDERSRDPCYIKRRKRRSFLDDLFDFD